MYRVLRTSEAMCASPYQLLNISIIQKGLIAQRKGEVYHGKLRSESTSFVFGMAPSGG